VHTDVPQPVAVVRALERACVRASGCLCPCSPLLLLRGLLQLRLQVQPLSLCTYHRDLCTGYILENVYFMVQGKVTK
jgi:hypothetical protein